MLFSPLYVWLNEIIYRGEKWNGAFSNEEALYLFTTFVVVHLCQMVANGFTVIRQLYEFKKWRKEKVIPGTRLGLVVTKGAIHTGHVALAQRARFLCDMVVVVVIATRAQFPDCTCYGLFPRRINEDIEILESSKVVDLLLIPKVEQTFKFSPTHGAIVRLDSDFLPRPYTDLEVASGECTVMAKMINLIQPTHVIIGQRDLVRARMIQRLLDDLLYDVDVITVPTVRTPEGVAYDARLLLLSPLELVAIEAIYRALRVIVAAYLDDCFDAKDLSLRGRKTLETESCLHINHVRIAHPYGFQDISGLVDPAIGAIAVISVHLGEGDRSITLADNVILAPRIPAHEQSLWGLVKSVTTPTADSQRTGQSQL